MPFDRHVAKTLVASFVIAVTYELRHIPEIQANKGLGWAIKNKVKMYRNLIQHFSGVR